MPSALLHALRDVPFDDGSAPRLEAGAAHVVDPPAGTRWSRRRRAAPGLVVSLLFHAVVCMTFVILWQGLAQDLSAPEGIPIDVVDSVPGEAKAPAPAAAPPPQPQAPEPKAPEATPAEKAPEEKPPALKPALEPPPPPDATEALKDALALPTPPPQTPAEPTAETREMPKSALAEPPPEPKAAATQTAPADKPNAATDVAATPDAPAPAPPEAAPEVLAAPQAETSVPAPAKEPDKPPPKASDPDAERSKAAAASLSAALPTSSLAMPSTFRAVLSSQGTSSSREYKGVVFGSLSRATQAVAEDARRRHLKGQVMVMITLAASGDIEKAVVVQSSGSAPVDALALDLVHRAAPFPAPPAGTSRSFTPVISIGEE